MSKKKSPDQHGYVYSTDPHFSFQQEEEHKTTLAPGLQKLRIKLDTHHRAGKTVTLIDGFTGTQSDLETLGKQLKNHCGTGGSAKDAQIIIQGDHRDKVLIWLHKNGYSAAKKL